MVIGQVVRVLAAAFSLWPSPAGAIIIVSAAFALLCVPLTALRAKGGRILASIRSELQPIQRGLADPRARRAELERLHRKYNFNPLALALPFVVRSGGLLVLFLGIRGLTGTSRSSTGAGSLPRGSALWQNLADHHGVLTSSGLDLSSSFASQPSSRYLALPALWLVTAMIWHRAMLRTGPSARQRAIAVLAAGSVLPAGLLIYLVTTGVVEDLAGLVINRSRRAATTPAGAFRDACRTAERLEAAGQPVEAARVRRDATARFVQVAPPSQLDREHRAIRTTLAAVAPHHPDDAVTVLTDLARRAPSCLDADLELAVLQAWARGADPRRGEASWGALWSALDGNGGRLLERFATALRGLPASAVRPEVRRLVTAHLVGRLDAERQVDWREATVGHPAREPIFTLLDLLAPTGAPQHREDWLCALGDLAAKRDDRAEAVRRYRAAVAEGSGYARPRLAYHLTVEGHHLLVDGDPHRARERLEEATTLVDDAEYRLLYAVSCLLSEQGDIREHLRQIERLRTTGLPAVVLDFWTAVGLLAVKDPAAAAATLRRAPGGSTAAASAEPETVQVAEAADVLLAALCNDDSVVAAYARELLGRHGRDWAQRSLVGAGPAVAAAARTDPSLLSGLLQQMPEDRLLSDSTVLLAAQALLQEAVRAATGGTMGIALDQLRLAERLLGVT